MAGKSELFADQKKAGKGEMGKREGEGFRHVHDKPFPHFYLQLRTKGQDMTVQSGDSCAFRFTIAPFTTVNSHDIS